MGAVQTVSFSITGEFITEHFRQRVLEGDWQRALKALIETIDGCTYDIAISVLKGEKRFVGEDGAGCDGITLDDEDGETCLAYEEQFDYLYGCLVNECGNWYKPYAVVTDYGREDYSHVFGTGNDNPIDVPEFFHNDKSLDLSTWLNQRAMKYADSFRDIAKVLRVNSTTIGATVNMVVLFQPMAPPPIWVEESRTYQEAVNDLEKRTFGLERRGHQKWFGTSAPKNEGDPDVIRNGCTSFGAAKDEIRRQKNLDPRQLEQPHETPSLEEMAAHAQRQRMEMTGLSIPSVDEYLANQKVADAAHDDLPTYQSTILEQNSTLADGRLIKHDFGPSLGTFSVPEAPLHCWSLRRTHGRHMMPKWEPVSPQGMKQSMDDQYHSDWMIGAGIDLDVYRDQDFRDASDDLMRSIQKDLLGFEITVLVKGSGWAMGTTVHPEPNEAIEHDEIAIVPNAGPDYYLAAQSGAGTIVERGGAMSHLAVVGLEENFLVVRDEGARKKYPAGCLVQINTKDGTIEMNGYLGLYDHRECDGSGGGR